MEYEVHYYNHNDELSGVFSNSLEAIIKVSIWLLIFIIAIYITLMVIRLIALWKMFVKADVAGWKCLIPIYNIYMMFDIVYGKGWDFLLLLIPLFNIYVAIKFYIDIAKVYGKPGAFGIGLIFFPTIFTAILGFGKAEYIGKITK